ncbi:MAG: TonB-dependent receptor plug domain-containing protein [Prevotellaceae bacterium]|jgi:outer membrane receptor for Fe3+-dicitrate|nr:TonB-dependent receptor plug domain-containing protein [Prevotellaceae bacterium]
MKWRSRLQTLACVAGVWGAWAMPAVTARAQTGEAGRDSAGVALLDEIIVTASQVRDEAPVTSQTIGREEIARRLGTKTFPEVMRATGGVYATSESGSYGDARINIRGFKQENITVLLNGVPLSGFRSGSMFWNNWLGLTDATWRIQLQKGVGGSMLAANSMGGTVNIVTLPAAQAAGGEWVSAVTGYGQSNMRLSLSTGEMKNGWALSFAGSRTSGSGYVEATDVDAWGYFLTLRKRFNARHSLLFTLLGSPERHAQRASKLSHEEVRKYGVAYNKDWGAYNGKVRNVSENFYHKPYFSATHFFTVTDNLFLSNTLYVSVGDGGGKWSESTGKRIAAYRDAGGQTDWAAVVADNANSTDSVTLPDGTVEHGAARNIQSDYLAGHTWVGLRSALEASLGAGLKLSAGLHYQYFYSWQNERITDLLGGAFWFEDYGRNSLAGAAGRNPRKGVGDYIRLDNGDLDNHLSAYAELHYAAGRIEAFAGMMLMTTVYRHWDRYNYISDYYSDPAYGTGGNLKAGLSFRLTDGGRLYLNGGYYSRMPYSNVYFAANTNAITGGVANERNYLAEAGYRHVSGAFRFTLNAYYNYWQNRALMSDPYRPVDDREVRYMITGLDARHTGVEVDVEYRPAAWLALTAFASVGDWQWKNDVAATIYDPYTGLPADTLQVFTDGLFVGDAPQTQLGFTATAGLFGRLEVRLEGRCNDRMYANFDPARRTDAADRSQSYRIPASFVADAHVSFPFRVSTLEATLSVICNNIFDARYIERGDDGATHDLSSFRGFWSIGRHFQTGLRISF